MCALKVVSNDFERVANARYNKRTTNEIMNHWCAWNVFFFIVDDSSRSLGMRKCEIHLHSVRCMPSEFAWKMASATSDAARREKADKGVTKGSRARKQDHVEGGFRLEATRFRPGGSMHKGFINFPGPWKFTPLPVRELLPRDSSRLRAKWIDRAEWLHKSWGAEE